MGPEKRDQTTPREDRVPGGADRLSGGPDDLRPAELVGSTGAFSPASGSDAVVGALALEEAEEERA